MEPINKRKHRPLSETREFWGVMNFYERFEQVIALVLSAVIAVIITIALWRLVREVVVMLILGSLDPLDHKVFQGCSA